jgi:hypothetical protein
MAGIVVTTLCLMTSFWCDRLDQSTFGLDRIPHQGTSLQVTPVAVAVPKGIPGSVLVSVLSVDRRTTQPVRN